MRNIAKSSPVGRSMPRLAHATIRMAASVCRLGGLLDRAHDGVERLAAIRYRAAVALWDARQRPAVQVGTASAATSAAPCRMARSSHPAASLDPSERANHPFIAMPTN